MDAQTKYTLQYIFDYSAQFLLEQGAKSENENSCLYEMDDGRMCAAGCLMTKAAREKYNSNTSFRTVMRREGLNALRPEFRSGDTTKIRDLVRELQDIHDHDVLATWARDLMRLAGRKELDPGILISYI